VGGRDADPRPIGGKIGGHGNRGWLALSKKKTIGQKGGKGREERGKKSRRCGEELSVEDRKA